MMKVLLVQCPCSFGVEMPPLGLAYLSSFLKKNKYDVAILDLSIILYSQADEKDKKYWKSSNGYCWYLKEIFQTLPFINEHYYDGYINKILSEDSDILGFSIQNTSALFTLEIIKRIKSKKPHQKIILGGPNCYNTSGNDSDFRLLHDLEKFADVIVIGEGENTLLNVLSRIESKQGLEDCRGIVIPKDGKWVFNGFSNPINNLDDLPVPDFDAYDLNSYIDRNALPVLTSRGCIMRCVFCTDTFFWVNYRYRKAQNVVSEIIRMRGKYHNGFVGFNDSLINGNHQNFVELCDLLIAKKVGIKWGGNFRVDKRADRAVLEKMKKSGCEYLIIGIESASNKILKSMRKGFTIEEVERFIHDCNYAGVSMTANWIIGFPGETEEDFMATVDFITKHRESINKNTFSTLTINQFSYLERHREEFGIVLDGPHLGLWKSADGSNSIELRNARLRYLEKMENKIDRDYGVVRQVENK
ncbi:MAG: radical SAM protein [Candidatus Omnitrophota bacterium]